LGIKRYTLGISGICINTEWGVRERTIGFNRVAEKQEDGMPTFTPEQWRRKESADWWSAGQVLRQQIYGAATEMMLELASIQPGSRVLDVPPVQVIKRSWRLDAPDQPAMYLPQTVPPAC
jgi:hypothetical protein